MSSEERFCPEHGGPADDCEQCRDERETVEAALADLRAEQRLEDDARRDR